VRPAAFILVRVGKRRAAVMADPAPIAPDVTPSLHFLVGGLHGKVDILLSRETANSKRIDALERRYWIGAGLGLAMLYAVGDGKIGSILKGVFG
jgi:hypothetical protein